MRPGRGYSNRFGQGHETMIDLHAHILWGLDDGSRTLTDSLEMCRVAYRDGIRTIVATPHTLDGPLQNDRPSILAKVRELNAVIKTRLSVNSSRLSYPSSATNSNNRSPITDNKYPVTSYQASNLNPQSSILVDILPGADVRLCERTLRQVDEGKVTTLGDGGRFLLIELPLSGIPHGAEEVLFQLMTRGITPIISHPERNVEVSQNTRRYHEMIRMGCLGQVTAMSLTGGFGPGVMRVAQKLLTNGLVHVIASDAHSTDRRPPVLSPAVRAAAKIVGEEEAWRMVTEYPRAILKGRRPNVVTCH